jgi:hypothetical protein
MTFAGALIRVPSYTQPLVARAPEVTVSAPAIRTRVKNCFISCLPSGHFRSGYSGPLLSSAVDATEDPNQLIITLLVCCHPLPQRSAASSYLSCPSSSASSPAYSRQLLTWSIRASLSLPLSRGDTVKSCGSRSDQAATFPRFCSFTTCRFLVSTLIRPSSRSTRMNGAPGFRTHSPLRPQRS